MSNKNPERQRLQVKMMFAWFDIWLGAYIDTKERAIYVCIIPMLPIKISIETYLVCESCGGEMHKAAHNTGDGWLLFMECDTYCGGIEKEIEWPYGNEFMLSEDLIADGFEIV